VDAGGMDASALMVVAHSGAEQSEKGDGQERQRELERQRYYRPKQSKAGGHGTAAMGALLSHPWRTRALERLERAQQG